MIVTLDIMFKELGKDKTAQEVVKAEDAALKEAAKSIKPKK